MAYERLSNDAARRIRATVLGWERFARTRSISHPGSGEVIQSLSYRGKLDEALAWDNDYGVTFSIWAPDESNLWADTGEDLESVLPPCNLAHALVPSNVWVTVEPAGGKWVVAEFPTHYQGVLDGDLEEDGSATVTVGEDSFVGCRALDLQTFTFVSGSPVRITLHADGYYYVDLGPC